MNVKDHLENPVIALKSDFTNLKEQYPNFQPTVAFVQVNQVSATGKDGSIRSSSVIRTVLKECGIAFDVLSLNTTDGKDPLIQDTIRSLNIDPTVHGIFIELPDDFLNDSFSICGSILPSKDIAGITWENVTNFFQNQKNTLSPVEVKTVLDFIERNEIPTENAIVYVLGNTDVLATISHIFVMKNAVVTTSSSIGEKLPPGIENADIIISSLKQSENIRKLLKPEAFLIDCSSSDGDILSSEDPGHYKKFISSACFWSAASVNLARNTFHAVMKLLDASWNLKSIPLTFGAPGLSDIEIARLQKLKDISVLAKEIGILPHEIELYGDKKAKISLSVLERCKYREPGKYVVVCGITPTPLGEGKSTTTVGLCQALAVQLEKNVIACLRQPSQGPTFGVKGGAAGGGYSQVVPMEEFNLHLTGDIHAVTAANNLLAAQIDARIFHEATQLDKDLFRRLVKVVDGKQQFSKIQIARLKRLGIDKTDPTALSEEEISNFVRLDIDPSTVSWHRVLDTNDRFLRKISIGLAATEKKMSRETQFDIAVASEIMAILALTTDMADMKKKLSKIVVANDRKGNPVIVEDLGVTGALAVLLKDTIRPNMMQTLEGAPVFVHAGPFANIAHGNSSIIADKLALTLVGKKGFVITEAGFGSDIGLEKFCNIKCRYSGLVPDVAVMVATIRALKLHGGGPNIASGGDALPKVYSEENLELVHKGYCNLSKHIEIANKFGLPVVVALNSFRTDTEAELSLVKELAEKDGAFRCVVCSHFSEGSLGAKSLAEAVVDASSEPNHFKFLYNLEASITDKIETISTQIYGAAAVDYTDAVFAKIKLLEKQGFGNLPVCMAKTPLSISADPSKKGVPTDFSIPIKDIKLSAGAGFVYPLLGAVSTMPGLSTRPCFYDMDIDAESGEIEGLS